MISTWFQFITLVSIATKFFVVHAERIAPSPWEDGKSDGVLMNSSTLDDGLPSSSYPQSIRKEYYRFIPTNTKLQQYTDISSQNEETTSPYTSKRELGDYAKPLLPTSELRFNKFKYITDEYARYYADFKPLTSKDYPIYGYVNKTLRIATNVHSVITTDDYEVKYDIGWLLEAVGGYPPMPDENEDNVFWKYLAVVIHAQHVRWLNIYS